EHAVLGVGQLLLFGVEGGLLFLQFLVLGVRCEQLGVIGGLFVGQLFELGCQFVEDDFFASAKRKLMLVHGFLDRGDPLVLFRRRQLQHRRSRAAAAIDA